MAQLKFGSAGVSAKEIDLTGPVTVQPTGIPAGIVGTSVRGRAYVPTTVGIVKDFTSKFGKSDGKKFGPLAVKEWLTNASSVTFLRVLGIGTGEKRNDDGSVSAAGFVAGEKQPHVDTGVIESNPYANANGPLGRTAFLGCFMSESAGSTVFSDAGLQGVGGVTPGVNTAVPVIRGVLMFASGVIGRLSASSGPSSTAPGSTVAAAEGSGQGSHLGTVTLTANGVSKQEFVLLLNGHKGLDAQNPNVITASFDMTAVNYLGTALNRDPYKLQKAGHYLYSAWDIYPTLAVVTGTGLVAAASGSGATLNNKPGSEFSAFLLTGSQARHTATATAPDYEGFEDRFTHAKTPWVTSQKFGGSPQNLFRFHAIDSGASISDKVKLSIENIVLSSDPSNSFGSFDVVIREIADRDTEQRVLEQFRGLNLDPQSDRYVAKIIGDLNVYFDFDKSSSKQKLTVDGNYENKSNYVRVEMADSVESGDVDATALPVGVRGYYHLLTSGSSPLATGTSDQIAGTHPDALKRAVTPPVPFRSSIAIGTGNKIAAQSQMYWGVQFEHVTDPAQPNSSVKRNLSIPAFATHFPLHGVGVANVWVGDNENAADTAANGIVDADRFERTAFSLENIKVVTGSSGLADPQKWANAAYVRAGTITADDSAKTRAWKIEDAVQANRKFAKFSLFMQGGFDGVNIFNRDEAELTNTAVTQDMDSAAGRGTNNGPAVKSYLKAIEIMQNTSDVDIQLLALPGIRHSVVTDTAIQATVSRFDALLIMDLEERDGTNTVVTGSSQKVSVTNTVSALSDRALNTSFAATYFPDVVTIDQDTKTALRVPPSVVVLGAFALNDKLGHPWFAPAGFTRGKLPSAQEASVLLSKENMDLLYDANVNPLVAFPGDKLQDLQPTGGVTVWGQKTLYAVASSLDRVNVRRLLISLRREVRLISRNFQFEPTLPATLAAFQAAVTPRLERVKQLKGLDGYRVVIDTTTTTQADIDNNTIRGVIVVKPKKTIEFVSIDFVVTNEVELAGYIEISRKTWLKH